MLGLYVIISIILLYLGAKYFVRSAVDLALFFHLKPYLIAMTVVAFATSMPELLATCIAQLKTGSADIALGNVIGSNIANIGLVLSLCCFVRPIQIEKTSRNKDFFHLLIGSLVFAFFLFKGSISRFDGGILLALFFLIYIYHIASHTRDKSKIDRAGKSLGKDIALLIFSFTLLVAGAEILIRQALLASAYFQISERVAGLFLVAVGTSIPELAISLVAAFEKREDISLGNIIGSNLFNTLFVVSIASFFRPMFFSRSFFTLDLPVMLVFTFVLWFMALFCNRLAKKEGTILLVLYIGYLSTLFFLSH